MFNMGKIFIFKLVFVLVRKLFVRLEVLDERY